VNLFLIKNYSNSIIEHYLYMIFWIDVNDFKLFERIIGELK